MNKMHNKSKINHQKGKVSNVECFSRIKYNCEVQKTKKAKPASFLLIILWTNRIFVGPNYCFFFFFYCILSESRKCCSDGLNVLFGLVLNGAFVSVVVKCCFIRQKYHFH